MYVLAEHADVEAPMLRRKLQAGVVVEEGKKGKVICPWGTKQGKMVKMGESTGRIVYGPGVLH